MGVMNLLSGLSSSDFSHEIPLPATGGHFGWQAVELSPLLAPRCGVTRGAFSAFTTATCTPGPFPETHSCNVGINETLDESGHCICAPGNCVFGDKCVAADDPCLIEGQNAEHKVGELEKEVSTLQTQVLKKTGKSAFTQLDATAEETGEEYGPENVVAPSVAKNLEERSANSIKLPQSTQKIKDVIAMLKGASQGPSALAGAPMAVGMRPGIQTLVAEAGEEGLGATVKDFSAALHDMVETVNGNLKKERIALMTTQDVPSLLRDTVIEMNNVNRVATYLRQKLAAITELSNLELGRAASTGHARLTIGAGAPVDSESEAMQSEKELDLQRNQSDPSSPEFSSSPGEMAYRPQQIEDADTMRQVYEMVDKTVRGKQAPMSSSLRTDIAQAVVDMLRRQRAAGKAARPGSQPDKEETEIMAQFQKEHSTSRSSNAPIEAGDARGGSSAAIVQKVLEEMRSLQTISDNQNTPQLLGFADASLARPAAAVLGAVTASSQSGAARGPEAMKRQGQPCRRASTSQARSMFLSRPTVAPAAQPRSQRRQSAAASFL